jgi:oxygen-dependent protoporphyrinogen oxidase
MTNTTSNGYKVVLQNGENLTADRAVLATPAYVSSRLMKPHHEALSNLLDQIPYASTATVSLAYRAEDVTNSVQGFGFVIPRKEGKSLIAATWTSLKWSNRTQSSQTLVRCFARLSG